MSGNPADEAGDPACWLHFVCPHCGRMREDATLTRCPNCGEPVGEDRHDAASPDNRRLGAPIEGHDPTARL